MSARLPSLLALLAALALGTPACKSQYPAVVLTVNGSYRIPLDVDTLRVDVYNDATNQVIESQTFDLQAGTNFPFTVLVVDSGTQYPQVHLEATTTLTGNNRPVGQGDVDVQLKSGSTVDATITLADQ